MFGALAKIQRSLSGSALRWYVMKLRMSLFQYYRFRTRLVERDGIRLIVRDAAISNVMFWHLHHNYESYERDLLEQHLRSGERVLEIGAGVGYLALVSLKRSAAAYVAVEANSDLLPLIAANMRENDIEPDSYQVINAVVSDSARPVSFSRSRNFWNSRIREGGHGDQAAVSTKSLRDQLGFRPTFLIMDIEGAEKDIAFENFADCEKILIELHPQFIGHGTCCTVLNRIISQGFELRDYRGTIFYLENPRVLASTLVNNRPESMSASSNIAVRPA